MMCGVLGEVEGGPNVVVKHLKDSASLRWS